jgi:hypothetical protein
MPFLIGAALLLIVLKLTNDISFSWWWVLSPFYPLVLAVLMALIMTTIDMCHWFKCKH